VGLFLLLGSLLDLHGSGSRDATLLRSAVIHCLRFVLDSVVYSAFLPAAYGCAGEEKKWLCADCLPSVGITERVGLLRSPLYFYTFPALLRC